MSQKYKCPHCGKIIEEVNVLEFTKRRVLTSAGLGIGCGLIFYSLAPKSLLVGAIGAFIVAFMLVFLVTKEKRVKKEVPGGKEEEVPASEE